MRPRVLGLVLVVGCVDGQLGFLTPADLDEIEAEVRRVTGNPIVELEASEEETVADLVVEARVLQRCSARGASGTFVTVAYRQTRWLIREEEEGVGSGWGVGSSHGQPYSDACAGLQPEGEPPEP